MNLLRSGKIWVIVFVISTATIFYNSVTTTTWVEKALKENNYSYAFKIFTGFSWKGDFGENSASVLVKSYLLFPGPKTVSIAKKSYKSTDVVTIDESCFFVYLGICGYILILVVSAMYLYKQYRHKMDKNSKSE